MNDPLPPPTAVRRKILLVDDDPELLALRRLRLEAEGYEVGEARDGALAMEVMAAFRPDVSLPARRWLHEVYYAQIAFRQKNKRWATSFEEMQITLPADGSLAAGTLHIAGTQWEAAVARRTEAGKSERWNIRQDSLVWRE